MKRIVKIIKKYNKCLIIFLLFILILVLMSKIPLVGSDDFIVNRNYGSLYQTYNKGLIHFVLSWNTRSSQVFAFFLGRFPRIVFYIVNSIAFLFFLYLCYFYSKKELKKSNFLFSILLSICYIFLFFSAMFDDFFWMAGSCNHLYSTILNLVFMLPFYNLIYLKKNNYKKRKIPFYLILAFITGMSIENIPIFIIPFSIFSIIYYYKKKKKFLPIETSMLISYIIGVGVLFITSKNRQLYFLDNSSGIMSKTGIKKIIYIITKFYIENTFFIWVLLITIIIYLAIRKISNKKVETQFKINIALLLGSLSTVMIFYFVPYYSNRATLFTSFFMLINYIYILESIITKDYIYKIINIILICIVTYSYIYLYNVYNSYNKIVYIQNKNLINDVKSITDNNKKIYYYFSNCQYGNRVIEDKFYYDSPVMLLKYYGLSENIKIEYKRTNKYNKFCIKYNSLFNINEEIHRNNPLEKALNE